MEIEMKKNTGQALLVILLIMAVGLTIGLAVISRSITDIRISKKEEESARAFSAAEAGIEQALLQGAGTYTIGDIQAEVTGGTLQAGTKFNFGDGRFSAGDIQTLWLLEHDGDQLNEGGYKFPVNGQISVCWGDDVSKKSAIEVTLFYKYSTDYRVARGAYDADSSRVTENKFDVADDVDGGNCGNFAFKEDINLITDFKVPNEPSVILYALRLKLLYNAQPQPIAVWGSANFPSQGSCYESTATSPDSRITRKVQQCRFYKAPPGIFDYVLFSEGDLTHQSP